MAERVGFGVVGAGAIGLRGALMHLSLPDVQDRVRLAAVCDPVPGRAAAAAAKYGVAAHYETYEALLADPGVDAVTLCSPIGLHFQQGLQALAAGKHIHFNKTMTTTVAEADELLAAAAAKGLKVIASPGMMLMPHNQRLRRLVLEGALGQLCWAITGTSAGSGTYHLNEEFRTKQDILTSVDPAWYFRRPGGGPQYDVTVYNLHILTGILGPARRITALSGIALPTREWRGQQIKVDSDDQTLITLDFGGALFAYVYATAAGGLPYGFQPQIFGTKGFIAGTKFGEREMKQPDDHQPHVAGAHAKMAESHVFEDMMQLADAVRDGTPSLVSSDQARHVIDIIESAYRAAATGQTQELRTRFTPLPLAALAQ